MICVILASSFGAFADSYNLVELLQTTNSGNIILEAPPPLVPISISGSGVDQYGRTYTESGKSRTDTSGLALYAAASLTGGTSFVSDERVFAEGDVELFFTVPANVYFAGTGLIGNGSGIQSTGNASVMATAFAQVGDYKGNGSCQLVLNGGYQTCMSPLFPLTPGESAVFLMDAQFAITIPNSPGSGVIDYWGTFTQSLNFYDANGGFISSYNFATPEPSTFLLLGTGALGMLGSFLRRFNRLN